MLKRWTPINVMSVMVFAMFMVDAMGMHPGQYPSYLWFVWGFISLALRGVDGLDEGFEQIRDIEAEGMRS